MLGEKWYVMIQIIKGIDLVRKVMRCQTPQPSKSCKGFWHSQSRGIIDVCLRRSLVGTGRTGNVL
jgi:hypothetical protein